MAVRLDGGRGSQPLVGSNLTATVLSESVPQRWRRGGNVPFFPRLAPPPRGPARIREVADDLKTKLPEPPRLPQRAAVYLAPDGSGHVGALFVGLLPLARALVRRADAVPGVQGRPEGITSAGRVIS